MHVLEVALGTTNSESEHLHAKGLLLLKHGRLLCHHNFDFMFFVKQCRNNTNSVATKLVVYRSLHFPWIYQWCIWTAYSFCCHYSSTTLSHCWYTLGSVLVLRGLAKMYTCKTTWETGMIFHFCGILIFFFFYTQRKVFQRIPTQLK